MNEHPNTLVLWLKEIRANFLLLPVVLVAVGAGAAHRAGPVHLPSLALILVGVILAHVSVNLFNEYSDWRTGIDEHTPRTPFSGGSGILQAGLIPPRQVRIAAWGILGISFVIGCVLAARAGWEVMFFMVAGGATAVFYTEKLARWMLGELASGLTLGTFVVLGAYFVLRGELSTTAVWASLSPGLLTSLLLLLNEFPDADADRAGGRRHLVIVLGKRTASILYALVVLLVYCVILAGVFTGSLPRFSLLALLTIPVAAKAVITALRYYDNDDLLLPAQGMNVIMVLVTDALLAVGLFLG